MNFKAWILAESDLTVGKVMDIPGSGGRMPFKVQIMKVDGGKITLRRVSVDTADLKNDMAGGNPFSMTLPAFRHFVNDLSGKVEVKGQTDDPWINKVLTGQATYLGKGDDGVAYDAGDMIVKVSTTVPFHPDAQHHRTPPKAARGMFENAKLTEMLRQQGVPGILPTYVKRVGDKAFMVRPKVEILKNMTREQYQEVKHSVEKMHELGYTINDEIQVGLYQGKMYHFDLGKMAKSRHKDDKESDISNLKILASRSSIDLPEDRWEYLLGMLKFWYPESEVKNKDEGMRRKYLNKLVHQKVLMDKAYPERAAQTQAEFEEVADKI